MTFKAYVRTPTPAGFQVEELAGRVLLFNGGGVIRLAFMPSAWLDTQLARLQRHGELRYLIPVDSSPLEKAPKLGADNDFESGEGMKHLRFNARITKVGHSDGRLYGKQTRFRAIELQLTEPVPIALHESVDETQVQIELTK